MGRHRVVGQPPTGVINNYSVPTLSHSTGKPVRTYQLIS